MIIYNNYKNFEDKKEEENEFEYLKEFLEEQDTAEKYIVFASIGAWNGKKKGYKIIKNLTDIFNLLYDYAKIYVKNNTLRIKTSHHDGDNYYIIKAIRNEMPQKFNDIIYYNTSLNEEDTKKLYKYTKNFIKI